MQNLFFKNRKLLLFKKQDVKTIIEEPIKEVQEVVETKSSSKNVYAFLNEECVGIYDSITKCGVALGMSRLMVRKAIENGVKLESGLILKLTNK